MKVLVKNIINNDLAINYSDGLIFYDSIKDINPESLIVSFEGISHLSTLFLNESIGRFTRKHLNKIESVQFIYPEGKILFVSKVLDVIENAKMGADYDNLVESAKLAL